MLQVSADDKLARVFVRRQVEEQQSIHARRIGLLMEFSETECVHRVHVGVEHDWNLRDLANACDTFQHFGGSRAGFEATLGSQLINQSISQRVAERHSQLQHVHTELVKGQRQLTGHLQVRIAGPNIDNEPFAPFLSQPGKAFNDPIHRVAAWHGKASISRR